MADIPTVAILAGGLGSRMKPLTEAVPKSLLQVAGEPFIIHQIRLLRRHGARRIVLAVGYLGDMIESLVGDGSGYDVDIRYSYDGSELIGTGGAIKKALPLLGEEFLVLYGDSYLDIPLGPVVEHFRLSGADGLMAIYENKEAWDTSNVVYKDGSIVFYSKTERHPDMYYIDYGLSMLRRSVFETMSRQVFDLTDLYTHLVNTNKMVGFEVHQRFYEIGSPQGLEETEAYILKMGH